MHSLRFLLPSFGVSADVRESLAQELWPYMDIKASIDCEGHSIVLNLLVHTNRRQGIESLVEVFDFAQPIAFLYDLKIERNVECNVMRTWKSLDLAYYLLLVPR